MFQRDEIELLPLLGGQWRTWSVLRDVRGYEDIVMLLVDGHIEAGPDDCHDLPEDLELRTNFDCLFETVAG